jgi:pyruvate dehydrogenase phosphatase
MSSRLWTLSARCVIPLSLSLIIHQIYKRQTLSGHRRDVVALCESKGSYAVPMLTGHTYNANDPSEDRWFAYGSEKEDWSLGYVLDGHGGWQVSDYAFHRLAKLIQQRILSSKHHSDAFIEQEILNIFDEVESSYIQSIRSVYKLGYGEVAKVGSCVLVAIKRGNKLTIANAGDCRAVLGTQGYSDKVKGGKFYSTRITMDHNCREPVEAYVLSQNHPGEANVIVRKNGRASYVKGRLQLTRALGDLYLKHKEFNSPPNLHSR